jgi:hypothetical protein
MDQDESTEPKKTEPISPDWVHESMDQPEEDDPIFEITDPGLDQPGPLAEKADFEQIDLGDGTEPVAVPSTDEPEFQDAIVDEMIDHEEGAIGEVMDEVDEQPVVMENSDQPSVVDEVKPETSAMDVASIFAEVKNLERVDRKDSEEALPTWLEATLDEPAPIQKDEITDKIKVFRSIEKPGVTESLEQTVTPLPAMAIAPEPVEDPDISFEVAYRSQHKTPEKRFLGMTAVQRFFFFLLLLIFLVVLGTLFLILSGRISLPFLAGL